MVRRHSPSPHRVNTPFLITIAMACSWDARTVRLCFSLRLIQTPSSAFQTCRVAADSGIVAIDPSTGDTLEVTSFFGEVIGSQSFNLANTAEGDGPDGAIRLFGLAEQLGLAESDYFVESFPLILTRFSNGVALVTGQVADSENDNLTWNCAFGFGGYANRGDVAQRKSRT